MSTAVTQLLTDRQNEVLEHMHEHFGANRVYPTVRELMAYMDIASPNGVMCHLLALQRKGYVVNRGNSHGCWVPKIRIIHCECPHCEMEIEVWEEVPDG